MTRLFNRRAASALMLAPAAPAVGQSATPEAVMKRAFIMKREAIAAGDQPYGAALAIAGRIVGESPSRVVTDRDPAAHAENSVLRDALRRGVDLRGATLYSTSIPCAVCQTAAAKVGVSRMIYGEHLIDAGAPRAGVAPLLD